jgi:hypothetical protein
MTHRRRVKQSTTLEERLARHADLLRAKAKAMPRIERERVLQKARQFEIALHISEWLTSPGLQPMQQDIPAQTPAVGARASPSKN